MRRDCFDSLSDRRSNERCEGAGKTALSWVCELLYSQSRVGVVGSQLLRAAGNFKPYFYCLYNSLAYRRLHAYLDGFSLIFCFY